MRTTDCTEYTEWKEWRFALLDPRSSNPSVYSVHSVVQIFNYGMHGVDMT